MKLDNDMKNNDLGSLSIKLLALKQSASFKNWRKSVKNGVLKVNQLNS